MKDINTMSSIQNEKSKEIIETGKPEISREIEEVFSRKRIAIDQPYTEVKYDPLR